MDRVWEKWAGQVSLRLGLWRAGHRARSRAPWGCAWLCHLLARCPWVSHLYNCSDNSTSFVGWLCRPCRL